MRGNVVKWLKPFGAFPVENAVWPGTPDVAYLGGWIELKKLDKWPARPTTPVRIPHFTTTQKRFLKTWTLRGGHADLLIQIKDTWLMFDGPTAAEHVGSIHRAKMMSMATDVWVGNKEAQAGLREWCNRITTRRSAS